MSKIGKKTISVIVVLCFIIAAFVTIAWGSNGFTNWKVSTWFTSQDKPTETKKPEEPTDKLVVDGMIVEAQDTAQMSLRMVPFASDRAADGVRITATIYPEDATINTVNYSIAWKNASSSWATNKTVADYVDISTAGLSATVKAKQPFGEQVIVTCTSDFDESISATCTVDYAKRLTSLEFHAMRGSVDIKKNGAYITQATTGKADTLISFGSKYQTVGMAADYGVGTVSDDMSYSFTITASDVFVNSFCSGVVPGSQTYNVEFTALTIDETFLRAVFGSAYGSKSAFYQKCSSGQIIGSGALKVTFSAMGTYSSMSGSFNLGFDLATLGTAVSNVELDQNGIVL